MGLYTVLQGFNDLLGRIEVGFSENMNQALIAKLLLLKILCFVESVGIYKQWPVLNGINLFAYKL
jgi:hypothetical protein